MPIQPYKKVRTDDDTLRKIQDNTELPLKDISSRRILDGTLILDIELQRYLPDGVTVKDNLVNHKLQRKFTGWLIIAKDQNADVWQISSSRPQDFITLRCSADCTISLWVF